MDWDGDVTKPRPTTWRLVAPWSHPRPAAMTDLFVTPFPRYLIEVPLERQDLEGADSWKVIYLVLIAGQQAPPWRGSGCCISVSAVFWGELDKVILKFNWKNKQTRRANTVLQKKKRRGLFRQVLNHIWKASIVPGSPIIEIDWKPNDRDLKAKNKLLYT